MSDAKRRAVFGRPNKYAFAPLSRMSPPPRAPKDPPPARLLDPDLRAASVIDDRDDFSIGRLALLAFGFVGATAMLPETAVASVVQVIDHDSADGLREIDLAADSVEAIAEEVDEADIAPALERAARDGVSISFRISIGTDGTVEEIETVRKVLDAIEGIDAQTEAKTVWAEYSDQAHKGLDLVADITEGLAGIASFVVLTSAGLELLRQKTEDGDGTDDDDPLPQTVAVQCRTAKERPSGPLAAGVKIADDMAKAMRKLSKALARIAG